MVDRKWRSEGGSPFDGGWGSEDEGEDEDEAEEEEEEEEEESEKEEEDEGDGDRTRGKRIMGCGVEGRRNVVRRMVNGGQDQGPFHPEPSGCCIPLGGTLAPVGADTFPRIARRRSPSPHGGVD